LTYSISRGGNLITWVVMELTARGARKTGGICGRVFCGFRCGAEPKFARFSDALIDLVSQQFRLSGLATPMRIHFEVRRKLVPFTDRAPALPLSPPSAHASYRFFEFFTAEIRKSKHVVALRGVEG
jgi:hypothetical protein